VWIKCPPDASSAGTSTSTITTAAAATATATATATIIDAVIIVQASIFQEINKIVGFVLCANTFAMYSHILVVVS